MRPQAPRAAQAGASLCCRLWWGRRESAGGAPPDGVVGSAWPGPEPILIKAVRPHVTSGATLILGAGHGPDTGAP